VIISHADEIRIGDIRFWFHLTPPLSREEAYERSLAEGEFL
jgi:hypothetical protein